MFWCCRRCHCCCSIAHNLVCVCVFFSLIICVYGVYGVYTVFCCHNFAVELCVSFITNFNSHLNNLYIFLLLFFFLLSMRRTDWVITVKYVRYVCVHVVVCTFGHKNGILCTSRRRLCHIKLCQKWNIFWYFIAVDVLSPFIVHSFRVRINFVIIIIH